MRSALKKDSGVRKRFRGIFVRIGRKMNYRGYSENTLLLKDITDLATGKRVSGHLWFSYTKGFEALGTLPEGAVIEFDARSKEYTKGYANKALGVNNKKKDYKLSNPTNINIAG